ncbi:MAG: trypsin-like peptidase domain-containing protein [Pseudomonadota bacterium]|nr:MAG: trypsin-like peptidase domain-containing protein [Pseudomonadota bacterium]
MNHAMLLRRARLVIAVAIVTVAKPVAAAVVDEEVFDIAKRYTVKVRTQVELPFYGDKKGTHIGAGFVVDRKRGWILTNAHVAARSPSQISVSFLGGQFLPAKKVYVDPFVDLAVLEIERSARPKRLAVAELDCGALPAIGHAVGAFGHPWELSFTGTRGIISGITAKFAGQIEMLQTDAPINPGNSGGPLISLKSGKVVGINTASRKRSQNTNFAVPMDQACRVLELIRAGRDPSPPNLGVAFLQDDDESNRLVVARTYAQDGTLELRVGDIVRGVEGTNGNGDVGNKGQLIQRLRGRLDDAVLRVSRDDTDVTVRGRLAPAESMTARRGVYASGILFAAMPWRDLDQVVSSALALMVHHVDRGSPGDAQRIHVMDLLLAIDGESVTTLDALYERLAAAQSAGREVHLKLIRVGDIEDSLFTYVERPLGVQNLKHVGGQ